MSLNPQCWYTSTIAPFPETPALEGEQTADVCIVGAGLTGCTAALHLARSGLSVRVLEAHTLGFGASGRSAGQVAAGYPLPLVPRILPESTHPRQAEPGSPSQKAAWETGVDAVRVLTDLIAGLGIDCDYVPGGRLIVADTPRRTEALRLIADQMAALGHPPTTWLNRADLTERIKAPKAMAGLFDPVGGHLNPLKLLAGIAAAARSGGVVFHENTPYLGYSAARDGTVTARTPWGSVRTRWLILAGNAFLWERDQAPDNKTLPMSTFAAVTEPLGADMAASLMPGNAAVTDMHVSRHRLHITADHRLLISGILTAATVDPFNVRYALKDRIRRIFPQIPKSIRLTHIWGGPISLTRHGLPQFGRLDRTVLFAHGYSGQGLAMAVQAGATIAGAVQETDSRFEILQAIEQPSWPGSRFLRTPTLLAWMTTQRLKDQAADHAFYLSPKLAGLKKRFLNRGE